MKKYFRLVFVIVSCVYLCGLLSGCAGQLPFSGGSGGTIHYAITDDNWKIALKRINFGGNGKPPVIMCHGLSYNDRFYGLNPQANLAQYLANEGYDVWIVSLRGSGSSTKWAYKMVEHGLEGYQIYKLADEEQWAGAAINGIGLLINMAESQMTNLTADPRYINWVLDDYADRDIPAVLKYVRSATGQQKVLWVGHSMGGIIMLIYLINNHDPDIAGLVTVGSQLTMPPGQVAAAYIQQMQYLRLMEIAGNSVEMERAKKIAQETADDLFFNPANRDPQTAAMLHSIGSDTPAVGVLGQYLELMASGELKTYDNTFNYAQNASRVNVPYLMMAGASDQLAPPSTQQFLYNNVSSSDKTKIILGPQEGFSIDYGHNDSIISLRAVQEVYPIISNWLDEHSY
ncbi:MAG: alpha/beta fold hydrolase [Candidatus Auribacter fodinae]|jgi:polyhydroxyalkanoate synthase|uniref:Alpha/beta fold hydrolase n=1 Tax=Candidatus Auribacter fodinae TaxID=2093366 RepID=A0A3A4R5G4_9BACT|nr:MAG: alpha/beta fold hydrolase [Candidatus Auribacter fodinae]